MKLLVLVGLIAVASAYPLTRGKVAWHVDESKCIYVEYDLGYQKVEFQACQTDRELANPV